MDAGKTYDFSSALEWFKRSGKADYGHALEFQTKLPISTPSRQIWHT